jgi:hypothetical protein
VLYNTFGHSLFLEDGIERKNYIAHNLIANVKRVTDAQIRLLPSDTDPAGLWITNPDNTFVHNHIAATEYSHCVWFAMPVNPMGPSKTPNMCPRRLPLLRFAHNVIHSCGNDGMHIDQGPDADGVPGGPKLDFVEPDPSDGHNRWEDVIDGFDPQTNGASAVLNASATSSPVEAVFEDTTIYKCRNRAVWLRGGLVTFRNAMFADNSIGITYATNRHTGLLEDGIFVGQTLNVGQPSQWEIDNNLAASSGRSLGKARDFPIRGYEFYDGPNTVRNIRCSGFVPDGDREASCISMLREDEFTIAPTNEASQVVLSDSSRMVMFPDYVHDGDKESVFIDLDGSVTGYPPSGGRRAVVVNYSPMLKTASCVDLPASKVYVCPDQYGVLDYSFSAGSVSWPSLATLTHSTALTRADDPQNSVHGLCGGPCNGIGTDTRTLQQTGRFWSTVVLQKEYMLEFKSSPPSVLDLRGLYHDQKDALGNWNDIVVGVCYGTQASVGEIRYPSWKALPLTTQAASLNELRTADPAPALAYNTYGEKMWFWDQASGILFVRLVTTPRTAGQMRSAWPASTARITMNNVGTTMGRTCSMWPNTQGNSDGGLPPASSPASPPSFAPASGTCARDDAIPCDTAVCGSAPPSTTTGFVLSTTGGGQLTGLTASPGNEGVSAASSAFAGSFAAVLVALALLALVLV